MHYAKQSDTFRLFSYPLLYLFYYWVGGSIGKNSYLGFYDSMI